MEKPIKKASIINIIANTFLFIIKAFVGLMFGALSILSDAVNSLGDIIAAILVFYSVRVNNLGADHNHEFGHTRAENIAGYTTGILMILLGLYIAKSAIVKLWSKEVVVFNYLMLVVVGVTLVVKLSLYFYIKHTIKNKNSPSLKANMQDHLNDVIVILGVFIAVIGIEYNIWWMDGVVSLLIAGYVLKEGINITLENTEYLMGKRAEDEIIEKIKTNALDFGDVLSVQRVLTQYLGNKIQVEIHIEVDKKLSVVQGHDIGENVKEKIEKIKDINNCFVHVDVYEE